MLIDHNRWGEYLAELSRQAQGYETTVEILSYELGDQFEVRRAPLNELSFDPREGIAIAVGSGAQLLRHVMASPVRLEATDDAGIPSTLLVESADGTRTLLRFDAPDLHD